MIYVLELLLCKYSYVAKLNNIKKFLIMDN